MFKALTSPPSKDQIIALAGVFQACRMVDNFARLGSGHPGNMKTVITSLLNQSPDSALGVYGSLQDIDYGLETIEKIFTDPKDPVNAAILRYVLGIIYITRKVSGNPRMMNTIGEGIAKAGEQAKLFEPTHTNVISNLADLYQKTISTLTFRIQVNGTAAYLQQQSIANKIRCLLFSAIRSGFLWQQMGGSRFHLMFRRDQVLNVAKALRDESRSTLH